MPKIGGQHEVYLIRALNAYKEQARSHVTMHANAASLSDEDIEDISAYFASFTEGFSVEAEGETLAENEESPATDCVACHGVRGNSDNGTYPKLAGQYESYIIKALTDYRSGDRKNALMSGFAAGLSDQDIRDLAEWFANQEKSDLKVLD